MICAVPRLYTCAFPCTPVAVRTPLSRASGVKDLLRSPACPVLFPTGMWQSWGAFSLATLVSSTSYGASPEGSPVSAERPPILASGRGNFGIGAGKIGFGYQLGATLDLWPSEYV